MTKEYRPEDLSKVFDVIDRVFPNSDDVKTILDIGSLHALESVEFSKKYTAAKIFAFEPNPPSYEVCVENSQSFPNISIINKCVNEYDGVCKFYPINPEKTITPWFDGNRGASSLYKSNGVADHIEKYVQDEIEVECIRVDSFAKLNNINSIDVSWIDVQGAGLAVLKSFGNIIDTLSIIHMEIETIPMYHGQSIYDEINTYLINNNFFCVDGSPDSGMFSNFIYVKSGI